MSTTAKKVLDALILNGRFVNSNSPKNKRLYNEIQAEFDKLSEYFRKLNLTLCEGDGFFYFATAFDNEPKARIEEFNKEFAILNFLNLCSDQINLGMTETVRFSEHGLLMALQEDEFLLDQLNAFKSLFKCDSKKEIKDVVLTLINELVERNFAEKLEKKETTEYIILNSIKYILFTQQQINNL